MILSQKASEILQDLAARKDDTERTRNSVYVFPSRQRAKKPWIHDLRAPLSRICQLADITGFRCHDLRHTFASWALAHTQNLVAVQKLLGHSDVSMTLRYSHVNPQDLVSATEGVAALIEQVAA